MTRSLPKTRTRWLLVCLPVSAALCAASVIAPGSAPATTTISCFGGAKLVERTTKEVQMTYQIACTEPITGISVSSGRQLDGFEPSVIVVGRRSENPVDGESLDCQGNIPGVGFACVGKASAANRMRGGFSASSPVCAGRDRQMRLRVIVTDSDKRISQPFGLRSPKCPRRRG